MNRAQALQLSLKALGGRLGAQWERERRDTLFLMLPVLVAVLPHLAWIPGWVAAGFMLLFAWRLGLLFSGRWLPRASVRWAGALAATAAVWAHYDTLLGREPGVALLILFLGLKLMEMRARRDLFAVIFLSLFLLLAAFLHSQTILTAGLVLIGLAGLLAAMLTMQYRRQEAPIGRRLATVAVLLLQAVPVAVVLFVLVPRPASSLWGLGVDSQRGQTGLSESMTPGAIAELGESMEIAFRVRFDDAIPGTASLYWRGPVFDQFDGATWRAREWPTVGRPAPEVQHRPASRIAYELIQEASPRPWLFALEMPVEVAPPRGLRLRLRHDLQLVASAPLDARTRFRIVSAQAWQAGLNETPESLRNALELPEGFNPRTLALAERWRAETPGAAPARDAQLVGRALEMFRNEPFRYTLRPPPLGRDGVDDFLFGTRAGFCEHYAGAFVVLMRALGIPARVVTGYQGGERNPVDGWWLVRQADAHAWAEVWLAGRGWTRIDPTAAVAPERVERGQRLEAPAFGGTALAAAGPILSALRHRLDAITNAWNQWLLSYDRTTQARLLQRFGLDANDWRALAAALALCLTIAVGVVAILTLHTARPRDPVQRAWQAFSDKLAVRGLARLGHEPPNAYLLRLEQALGSEQLPAARRIVSLYNRLRYGPADDEGTRRADMRHFRECVRQFRP